MPRCGLGTCTVLAVLVAAVAGVGVTLEAASSSPHVVSRPPPTNLPRVAQLRGRIDDCCCDAESVDRFNNGPLYDTLTQLTKTEFFKYFQVNYLKPCPFWAETMLCGMTAGGGCGVCECKEDEIPEPWRKKQAGLNDRVDATLATDFRASTPSDSRDVWCECDESEKNMVYLDLQRNPERYTGYGGYNATRIWLAIYRENCFQPRGQAELCLEERTLNRLVSGFHGSTTAHICESYFRDGKWEPNVEMFAWRLGNSTEFLENIYFTFLFIARAVSKMKTQLLQYPYDTGKPTEDHRTRELVRQVLEIPLLCSPTFDESLLFRNSDSHHLREDLRSRFKNISQIMDCVECETCKVHAKLQMLGIGTALKILLPSSSSAPVSLQPNEVIALVNTLHKFSETIRIIELMRGRRDAIMAPVENAHPTTRGGSGSGSGGGSGSGSGGGGGGGGRDVLGLGWATAFVLVMGAVFFAFARRTV